MKQFLKDLGGWFFAKGDPRTAALFRISYMLLVLFNLWDLYPGLHLLLGNAGVYGTLEQNPKQFMHPLNLLFFIDSPAYLEAWFWCAVAVGVTGLFGFFSRCSSFLVLVTSLQLHERAPFTTYGVDVVMNCIGLWLLFMQSGKRWAVDAWIADVRGRVAVREIEFWPLRCVQIQIAQIYLITGLYKIVTTSWQDGSAVYYALHLRDLNPHLIDPFFEFRLPFIFATYSTLFVEIGFLFFVFYRPLRWWGILAATMMHLGIDTFFSIRFFSLAMYVGYISFLEKTEWAWIDVRWTALWKRPEQLSAVPFSAAYYGQTEE